MMAEQNSLRIAVDERERMDVLGTEPSPRDRLAGLLRSEQEDGDDSGSGDRANRDWWHEPLGSSRQRLQTAL